MASDGAGVLTTQVALLLIGLAGVVFIRFPSPHWLNTFCWSAFFVHVMYGVCFSNESCYGDSGGYVVSFWDGLPIIFSLVLGMIMGSLVVYLFDKVFRREHDRGLIWFHTAVNAVLSGATLGWSATWLLDDHRLAGRAMEFFGFWLVWGGSVAFRLAFLGYMEHHQSYEPPYQLL